MVFRKLTEQEVQDVLYKLKDFMGNVLTVVVAAGWLSFWDYLATEKGSS